MLDNEQIRRRLRSPSQIDLRLLAARAPSMKLDAAVVEGEPSKPVWIQLAEEGEWAGHHQGEFGFDARKFDTMTANFRRNPTYLADPGNADVIPFDWAHASEMDPTSGSLPVTGAPAWAWLREVERRPAGDGKALFWGLTDILEPAREYIKTRRLKWVSLSVWFDAVDFVTNEPIGPLITSVAFTNNPFLKGMVPMALTARGASGTRQLSYYGTACSAGEVLNWTRSMFGLPQTAGAAEVIAEVQKLRSYIDGGEAPTGVDVGRLMGGLREILGCKPLDDDATVFAEFDKLLPRLAEDEARQASLSAAASATMDSTTATERPNQETPTMPLDMKQLAVRYGLAANATEPDVLIKLDANAGAAGKLGALLKALGVEDSDGAMARITGLLKQAADLTAAMPELAELVKGQVEDEDATAEDDVEKAMATYGLPPDARHAMLGFRTGGLDLAAFKLPFMGDLKAVTTEHRKAALEALNVRRAARARFAARYPQPTAAQQQQAGQWSHLTQGGLTSRAPAGAVIASGGAPMGASPPSRLTQVGASGFTGGMQRPAPPAQQFTQSPHIQGNAINLSSFPGANDTQRAMNYLKAQPGGATLTFDQLHAQAAAIVDGIAQTG